MIEYNYEWKLSETNFAKNKGTVFSCFACGGGSTMGYKLAGFDVVGCNEIDPRMMKVYIENHHPKYSYLEPIQTFKLRNDLPDELYNLDILDGSPPCSSFSIAGNREDDWGENKKFREGQADQVLDTLFFDFIDLAKKLQPKVVIAENVKGLLVGNAINYVQKIITEFQDAGYKVDFKLLNASNMGIPQKRERVFFYAIRNDIPVSTVDLFGTQPKLDLNFNEKEITFKEIRKTTGNESAYKFGDAIRKYLKDTLPGNSLATVHPKGSFFNEIKVHPDKPTPTIRASGLPYDYIDERMIFEEETILSGSFPLDYNFGKEKPGYIIGMSVPPLMIAKIADEVYTQWLSND